MTPNQKIGLGAVIAIVVVAATAIGATVLTQKSLTQTAAVPAPAPLVAQQRVVHHYQPTGQTVYQQRPAAALCNDHNVVGTVGGGLGGALLGHQFGKGSGRTVATVAGAAGGAYLGNEYIPTRGATCN